MSYHNNPFARKTTWVALGASMLAAAFLTGCPSLTVDQIDLDADTVTSESFTLTATVEVVEEDPAVDDDGNLGGGRGALGVWLPPGWEVTGARLMGPDDADFAELTPLEDADGHFPPPFPYVEGSWFGFVSECDHIEAGTFLYEAEMDVQGDGSQTEVTLGVSTALFDDEGSNGSAPTEVRVDLTAATAEVRDSPAAPATAGLPDCESIPYEEPDDKGDCGCSSPGASRSPSRPALLDLFAAAL